MSFYRNNEFAGEGYAHAGCETSVVLGEKASVAAGVEAATQALSTCDAVVVGAGAGLSTAAGIAYAGERFDRLFPDFRDKFGITDMYSGGFYPFPDMETYWAWWSRHIVANRYDVGPTRPYEDLLAALRGKEYFAITTNVDHQFQLAGFADDRLFCTQGDYGLFQCARNCSGLTYGNEEAVRAMVREQRNMHVPSDMVPTCPRCGASLAPNLRVDGTFCEDKAWREACERYGEFLSRIADKRVLFLELGIGWNTPVIVKFPFWRFVADNSQATYMCVNRGDAIAPEGIASRSILVDADIAWFLSSLRQEVR